MIISEGLHHSLHNLGLHGQHLGKRWGIVVLILVVVVVLVVIVVVVVGIATRMVKIEPSVIHLV